MKKISILLAVVLIGGTVFFFSSKFRRKPPSSPSGSLRLVIKGSDTEVQLVSNVAELFSKGNSGADIRVTGGGSGVGIASLLNREIDIANSSRAISDKEIEQAKSKQMNIGEFRLARDGIAVIVHPENPIQQLTLEQVGKIYKGDIVNWNMVGGTNGTISLYGRQTTSGTFVFFRDFVVKAEYASGMRNMEGNQAIVDAVKEDQKGIGYVGIGYIKDAQGQPRKDIKVIPIVVVAGQQPISPLNKEAVQKGEYPISRTIFQYIANTPKSGSLLEKFLRFEVSGEGQTAVEQSGFYSLAQSDSAKNQLFFGTIK